MSVYFIVFVEKVTDPAELAEYRRIGVPSLQGTNVGFRVKPGKVDVLEGDPVESVVMLEFPTKEEALAWYNSPTYQEALGHRRKAAKCRAVLVQGT